MHPDLGVVSEGSPKCIQRGVVATLGLDISQSDMGNL